MDFTGRPAALDDAHAIYELIAAAEVGWHGQAEVVVDQVAADLRRPLIDLALDTLVIEAPGGQIAAWAWNHGGKRAQVDVHPSYRGQGLGPRLLDWAEARSRAVGSEWIAQAIDDADKAGTALVQSRGYDVLATNWLLERPLDPVEAQPPTGIRLAAYDAGRAQEVYDLAQEVFGAQQRRKSLEEWAELTIARPAFLPEASTLAYDGDTVVGLVIALDGAEGYVEQLAVGADHRNRGIARAMLDRTCAEFRQLGRGSLILWTHSGTGALAMYEHLGLRVRRSTTVHRLAL